MPDPSLSTLTI